MNDSERRDRWMEARIAANAYRRIAAELMISWEEAFDLGNTPSCIITEAESRVLDGNR